MARPFAYAALAAALITAPAALAAPGVSSTKPADLPAGNYVEITIADGREQCVYDMKFVMEDDTEFVESGVDLCELGEYTLSDAR